MPNTTRSNRHIQAPPDAVYRVLIDRDAVERWRVPEGMTSCVHRFEPWVGGAFRVSLTYDAPHARGKTSAHTDTYRGQFVQLVPGALVVERIEFEANDPSLAGQMTVTYRLTPSGGGTDLLAIHEGLPDAVRPEDNELGWQMSLDKLAALVEQRTRM